jgi:hypothetical protein
MSGKMGRRGLPHAREKTESLCAIVLSLGRGGRRVRGEGLRATKTNARREHAIESTCSSSGRGQAEGGVFALSVSDFFLSLEAVKLGSRHQGRLSSRGLVACGAAINRSASVQESESSTTRRGGKEEEELGQTKALQDEIQRLSDLLRCLKGRDVKDQILILKKEIAAMNANPAKNLDQGLIAEIQEDVQVDNLSFSMQLVLYSILALNQNHVLETGRREEEEFTKLLHKLELVQQFYDSIGGIIGYQLKVLELIMEDSLGDDEEEFGSSGPDGSSSEGDVKNQSEKILFPSGHDISDKESKVTSRLVQDGLRAIPDLAEVYPVGGAGDRLGLIDETTGQPLPTALLPYCGRSLLENLVRDVQARENLYYRIYGEQHRTPIAIMTSDAKGNHGHITQICEESGWFGRRSDTFYLFKQPLVPVVNGTNGEWLVSGKFEVLMKPSGHGAIWKLMYDRDVLGWFGRHKRGSALVRQISNPMAATDTTMIALAGKGHGGRHTFGFASCERKVGASEGCNVTKAYYDGAEGVNKHAITCVEYTEFEKYGLEDSGMVNSEGEEVSRFPANTNILYFNVDQVQSKLDEGAKLGQLGTSIILPGMIFNRKKTIRYTNKLTGEQEEVKGGRLECSMQNLADVFRYEVDGHKMEEQNWLPTFLLYNKRQKVTSSAKKRYEPSSKAGSISQTPEGSFYDLMQNARELLRNCKLGVPPMPTVGKYLEQGPNFVFLFHPALGPLWSVISQKIRGGSLGVNSELVLEIAEVALEDVQVKGSLLVQAENVMGEIAKVPNSGEKEILYSDKCGKCRLENVTVENKGIDYKRTDNVFWKHDVKRLEQCEIVLRGNAEFVAKDVTLHGKQRFEVPDGHKMVVSADETGRLGSECIPLDGNSSWIWQYKLDENDEIIIEQ